MKIENIQNKKRLKKYFQENDGPTKRNVLPPQLMDFLKNGIHEREFNIIQKKVPEKVVFQICQKKNLTNFQKKKITFEIMYEIPACFKLCSMDFSFDMLFNLKFAFI